MKNKQFLLPLFFVTVLAQLYVPAKMIFDREAILNDGKAYKFQTAPIDPNDPFRGKYVYLSFNQDNIEVTGEEEWLQGERIFVLLEEDDRGFVKVAKVAKTQPASDMDYIKAHVSYVVYEKESAKTLYIQYPFDRFYMEEAKAYPAETLVREAQRDSTQIAYALVKIKNGDAVLEEVFINDVPLKDAVKQE